MQNKQVFSYDIYDTIIARKVKKPTDIFDIIEKKSNIPNFKKNRIIAEQNAGLTLDSIYEQFREVTGLPQTELNKIKQLEIETEIENSYLIMPIYTLINNGDILVSDMYFNSEQLGYILKNLGFEKDVKIYSSSSGVSKANGTMYEYLKKIYNIQLHTGDNIESDIKQANKYKIASQHVDISNFNDTEQFFMDHNYASFAFILRQFRHKNPYKLNTHEYKLYNDQATYNIPILVMLSSQLNDMMVKEKRDTLLCLTRDGCLLEHVFKLMYPNHKCVKFHSSRYMNNHYNQEYVEYVRSNYNHSTCLLFDVNGSFYSGQKLFMEAVGVLPRIHLFRYNNFSPKFDGLTCTIDTTDNNYLIEVFNSDTIGTLVGMKNGHFIRNKLEYNLSDVTIYRDTVIDFCEFLKSQKLKYDELPSPSILDKFYFLKINVKPELKGFEEEHKANKTTEGFDVSVLTDNKFILGFLVLIIALLLVYFYTHYSTISKWLARYSISKYAKIPYKLFK
jgi:hypothetical protein